MANSSLHGKRFLAKQLRTQIHWQGHQLHGEIGGKSPGGSKRQEADGWRYNRYDIPAQLGELPCSDTNNVSRSRKFSGHTS